MYGTFDKQPKDFREDIIEHNSLVVTLEAEVLYLGKTY